MDVIINKSKDGFKRLYYKSDKSLILSTLRRIPDKYLSSLMIKIKGKSDRRIFVRYDGYEFLCSRKTLYDEYFLRHYGIKKYQFDIERMESFREGRKFKYKYE